MLEVFETALLPTTSPSAEDPNVTAAPTKALEIGRAGAGEKSLAAAPSVGQIARLLRARM
jgi:hypothetical protein